MARKYLIILLSITLIMSCSDIFSTRDPEDPNSDGNIYLSESISELVTNFKASILSMDKNSYESLFIDEFATEEKYSFQTLAKDITQPDIFIDWDIDNEKLFINELKISGSTISNIVINYENADETQDSLDLELEYSMNFTDSSMTHSVKGIFTFEVIKVEGHFWYIKKWIDEYYDLSSGELSFSKLKEPYIY